MTYRILSFKPKGNSAINIGQLTVLVGPNNSGKSQTLKDIRQFTSSGSNDRLVILDNVQVTLPTQEELRREVSVRPHENSSDHINITGVRDDLLTQASFGPHKKWFEHTFQALDDSNREKEVLRSLGTCFIGYLGAEARFKLTISSAAFNPRSEAPSNAIQSLFAADSSVQEELREAFRKAFNMDIALDWGAMTKLYLRVARDFGDIPDSKAAIDSLMADKNELETQGDGFRSFAGIALALLTYPTRMLLLDEPEAFLHPAQARVLGRWIGQQASKRPAQIVIATHSSDFLAGLFAGSDDATIMRLNRTSDGTSYHEIPHEVTGALIESPLLSSQPVLDALFHKGVVICEGDPDRAVYQTVAQRYLDEDEFLFIHSNGKDAAKLPAELLHKSGTPVCVIVDFDILNSEKVLNDIAKALTGDILDSNTRRLRQEISIAIESKSQEQSLEELKGNIAAWSSEMHQDLRLARRSLVSLARAGSNKWERAKKRGISCMSGAKEAEARGLIEELAKFGVFVVPCGELESWMELGRPKGSGWNQAALQALHANSCPEGLKNFVEHALTFLGSSANRDII